MHKIAYSAVALLALTHCATNEAAPVKAAAPEAPPPAKTTSETAKADPAAPTALIQHIASGRSKTYPLDRKVYENVDSSLPIGVFDSGIGGLTVLNAILRLDDFNNRTHQPGADGVPDFESERFIYYGDQANMPYGKYPSLGKENFLRELVVEDALFLLGSRYWLTNTATAPLTDKPAVKAVVVACNTATAYGINDLRAAFDAWKIPMILIGVVEAGSEGAVTTLKQQGANGGAVAVMATVGTCKSNAYPKTIERFSQSAGARAPKVVQQGSVGLAGAIEGDPSFVRAGKEPAAAGAASYQGPAVNNAAASLDPALAPQYGFDSSGLVGDPKVSESSRLNSVENYVRYDVATLVENYRREGGTTPISAVVLGCTHFPFQRDQIFAQFERLRNFKDASGALPYQKLIAPSIELVDPAKLTARQLYVSLNAKSRLAEKGRAPALEQNAFFISKPNVSYPGVKLTADGTFDTDYKYGRKPGDFEAEYVKRVPLRTADLTPPLQSLLQKAMPAVWESLQTFQSSRWTGASKQAAR